ncbi:hypothetical protein [Bacillus sp. CECT 9360]|uniref:hypothetical protein n=1 Tax=Bacillus sp. CECT 9360 TaxID=2845821 RepID=UPI001E5E10B9|nr:hypothetical protein [Bacillus sp. CECT 9360]CAH0345266.1 hypothetical protein BCI9360_01547 [Bacillus sp. CECT 9360]
MAVFNIEEWKQFVSHDVETAILDQQGEMAPSVRKNIRKVEICPDGTHLRLYFDNVYFLAIPLTSEVSKTGNKWAAFDQVADLTYIIKKVDDFHE